MILHVRVETFDDLECTFVWRNTFRADTHGFGWEPVGRRLWRQTIDQLESHPYP